jgi:short-subunit dehydrogenase
LKDKVVVTGASSGVGRAISRAAAAQGARVALIARGIDGLVATASEVKALGGEAFVCPLDLADARAVDRAADRIASRSGGIDVWVNNAMAKTSSVEVWLLTHPRSVALGAVALLAVGVAVGRKLVGGRA